MPPLLKSLLGHGSKDRELTEEMRSILVEMQKERGRYEALLVNFRASADHVQQIGEPLAKAASEADAVASRLADVERRFTGIEQLASQLHSLNDLASGLTEQQNTAEAQVTTAVEEAQRIRSLFEDLSEKFDMASGLKDRLGSFLEVEKPFQQLREDAEALRGQVDGTGDQLVRLREQHDRLMDAHKLAMSKMEALDRRRDDLGRSMTDKERRVSIVEQAVHGLDGIRGTVDDVRREIGTLKALADTVVQKTAALEAQREAVERALAEASRLEQAMRQLDAGVRQQQENEKSLGTLQEHVSSLRSLHETVVERSSEIAQLQHETDESTRAAREDLTAMTDEMKKTVERFDFESRGLESVNHRVADLRGSLADFENRFKGLTESSQTVAELRTQTQSITTQVQSLSSEVGKVDREVQQLRAIRRDLDETGRSAHDIGAMVSRIEEARPAITAGLREIDQLAGAHAMVRDALEQTKLAHEEMSRVQYGQAETRSWLDGVEQSVVELKEQVSELNQLAPVIEHVQKQAQRISESTADFESGREFVEDLKRSMVEITSIGEKVDDRGKKLLSRMDAAEQRFSSLEEHAEEAERLGNTVGTVVSNLREAGRKADEIKKTVATIETRCESVEALAESTTTLKQEIEQRHHALAEATKDLQAVSELREKAAAKAQQLGELSKKLSSSLANADDRVTRVDELSTELEDRVTRLQTVENRLARFEERLASWDSVETEIGRSLEQIVARQDTVEALQADLERMFAMAEKTSTEVREITSANQEIEKSRQLLETVMGKLGEMRDMANALDERKRQMSKAEERLSRAEALLVDVGTSLEALQGQKAIVDQAVEKAGSLQFLLKQAEATIDGLREEREITSRVQAAVSGVRQDDKDDAEIAKAA